MSEHIIPLSVVIHTKNSASTLQECLDSVKFASEVIIIDMESTDDTKKIAEKNNVRFIPIKDEGYGYADPMRNFGLSKATQEWILVVDSDERVSPGLEEWIRDFIEQRDQKEPAVAYRVPRLNSIFGQEIHHSGWWPDYQVRFFKKGFVEWEAKIHSVPNVQGRIIDLPDNSKVALLHDNYPTVEKFIERMNRYTSVTAKEKGTEREQEFSEQKLVKVFSEEFNRRMFHWDGIEDGGVGVGLSFLQATYELIVELKRWEKMGFAQKPDQLHTLEAMQAFSNDVQYWVADWHVKHSSGLKKLYWKARRKLG